LQAQSLDAYQDHLIHTLEQLESEFRLGLSEYELLSILRQPPYALFCGQSLSDPLTLFRCHFALFNGLYRLRDQWLASESGVLVIHTTKIQLQPYYANNSGLAKRDPLAEYYLDWANFKQTDADDVNQLIESFWRTMGADTLVVTNSQELNQARDILGLSHDDALSSDLVKRQYRKRQHQQHPDKGGTADDAQQLNWAYELLLKLC
jgi:hypothetical protein